jgi:acetyl-CoA acetyltransferase
VPEAVLVSAARSPIGRAGKGSLVDLRPDDLVAAMIRTALDKIPALDRHDVWTTCISDAACRAASPASTWPASST